MEEEGIFNRLLRRLGVHQQRTVTYGRSVEVGRFGRGESGKVWFGWSVDLEDGESPDEALAKLRAKADAQELFEKEDFERRKRSR